MIKQFNNIRMFQLVHYLHFVYYLFHHVLLLHKILRYLLYCKYFFIGTTLHFEYSSKCALPEPRFYLEIFSLCLIVQTFFDIWGDEKESLLYWV